MDARWRKLNMLKFKTWKLSAAKISRSTVYNRHLIFCFVLGIISSPFRDNADQRLLTLPAEDNRGHKYFYCSHTFCVYLTIQLKYTQHLAVWWHRKTLYCKYYVHTVWLKHLILCNIHFSTDMILFTTFRHFATWCDSSLKQNKM